MGLGNKWVLALALVAAGAAQAGEGYYRWPAIRGESVVFTSEGDLWLASVQGGGARRLTTHKADETMASISPDGRWLAFAASYDAAQEVYVMPLSGGEPRRVSFDGGRVWVQGWTPRGEVVYASENVSGPSNRRVLRAVFPATLAERTLPLADANEAAFAGENGAIYFTRFGLHVSTDNARQYRGGAMAQLWRFDPSGQAEAVRLVPDVQASLRRPMWWQQRLYFVSDESGTDNLWSMAPDGSDRRQLTQHGEFEVRGASLGDGRIVYQLGADLHVYDIASAQDREIPLQIASDHDARRTRWLKKPLTFLTSANFAPGGDRVVLTARGRAVIAGPGPMRRIEVALPESSRARDAVLSPDGAWVYAVSDGTGGNELWRFPADGSGPGTPLTRDGDAHRWRLYPSPDGKRLAHEDKRGRLRVIDLATGNDSLIDTAKYNGDQFYESVVWSPDGSVLAFVRSDTPQSRTQLFLYDFATQRTHRLTSDRYDSGRPAFSADGRWLYFLSNRHFAAVNGAPWGDRNMGPFFDKRTKVYALALQEGLRFPFLPSDELARGGAAKSDEAGEGKGSTRIAWDGLRERLYEVPLAPGNYSRLALDSARLYLLDQVAGPEAKPELKVLAIDANAPQPELFMAEVRDFALSNDRKKVFFMKWNKDGPGDMFIVDAGAKAPADLAKLQVRVADWALPVVPAAEWKQMFVDAWRMHRDFSFDPAMRGVDWSAVRARYEPLVARVNDRWELDDLIGQMTSELGILHSQVRGAEFARDEENATAGFLGATYEAVQGGVAIRRIYRTEFELPSERGPLQMPGVNVREGDVLVAVNGVAVRHAGELAQALHQQGGQQVLLKLKRGNAAPHGTVVTPVAADKEATLRYGDWVIATREKVLEAGEGRIGYLHLRAMGAGDIANFAREFYANYDREGLIIDVRRNRGGNIDSWIIEKLLRRTWAFWQPPGQAPYWNMQQTFRGHLVVLVDELTYSDGETFAAGVKALGLGPLIGTRTSGAGIWLSDRNRLVDNGTARVAEFAQYGVDGRWLLEGRGVAPDIVVENPPHGTFQGEDRQLDAALANLAQRLAEKPIHQPEARPISPRGTPGEDVR